MSQLLDLNTVRALATMEIGPGDTLLPHLLEAFAADATGTLERMREAARSGEARDIGSEARRLRTGSASIGATLLARELGEIELGARRASAPVLEARLTRALEVLYQSCEAILELCNRAPAGKRH